MSAAILPHPDASLLFACDELAAIRHGAKAFTHAGWQDAMRIDLLTRDAVTLEGSRARAQAIESEWPDVWTRPTDAPVRQIDEVWFRESRRVAIVQLERAVA